MFWFYGLAVAFTILILLQKYFNVIHYRIIHTYKYKYNIIILAWFHFASRNHFGQDMKLIFKSSG